MSVQTVKVGSVVLDDLANLAVQDYSRLGVQIKALEAQRDAARKAIIDALGGAPEGTYNGVLRVTATNVQRTVVDAKELATAFPEAYAATTRTTEYVKVSPK